MRVSAREDDPGYTEKPWVYEVYLDGERLTTCVTADEEAGEVICFKTDRNGHPIPDFGTGDPALFTFRGKVEIIDRRRVN